MAIAYWCIVLTAFLPHLWITISKSAKGYDNRNPRDWVAKQTQPRVQRGNAAHLNAFEAFPAFAAGVLMAQAAGVDPFRITILALVFLVVRILHGVFYLADKHMLRSLSWLIGILCVALLMVQAAMRVG